MKLKTFLTIAISFSFSSLYSQQPTQKYIDSLMAVYTKSGKMDSLMKEMKSYTAWKTADNFFSNKISVKYYGDDISITGRKVKLTDNKTKKKISFSTHDSLFFAYNVMSKKNVLYLPMKDYASFCGGTKELYIVIFPMMDFLSYDADGYATSGSSSTFDQFANYDWYIVTDIESKEKNKAVEKAIADEPALLQQYLDEKAKMNKKEWDNNNFTVSIKYIKKYNKLKSGQK